MDEESVAGVRATVADAQKCLDNPEYDNAGFRESAMDYPDTILRVIREVEPGATEQRLVRLVTTVATLDAFRVICLTPRDIAEALL